MRVAVSDLLPELYAATDKMRRGTPCVMRQRLKTPHGVYASHCFVRAQRATRH